MINPNEFNIYRRETETAKVIFNNNKAYINLKNLKTGSFGDFVEFIRGTDSTVGEYSLPIDEIGKYFSDYINKNWDDSKFVTIKNKYKYSFNKKENINEKEIRYFAERNIRNYMAIDVITIHDDIIAFLIVLTSGLTIIVKKGFEKYTPLEKYNENNISLGGRGITHLNDYMIPMRDGTKLSTGVWLPSDYKVGEKLPTVFIRTPYGKVTSAKNEILFCDRGYAVVVQDVRGREDSEGEMLAYYYEKNDGDDSLNWIAEQEWSNGKIGTIGASYCGNVQWSMACSGNKHLKAIISISTSGSPFTDCYRRNGTYYMAIVPWFCLVGRKKTNFSVYNDINWKEVFNYRPLKYMVRYAQGFPCKNWEIMFEHPDYDEFWKEQTFTEFTDNINVNALIMDGYYDGDLPANKEVIDIMKKSNKGKLKVVYGPWVHQLNTVRDVGEFSFGNNAIRYDIDVMWFKWFDKFLKGNDNKINNEPNEYYLPGENKWMVDNAWPPSNTSIKEFYLQKNSLSEKISEDGFLEYEYNPLDATPMLFDPATIESSSPLDYSQVEDRKDVLIFTTKIISQTFTICGNPIVELYASSSAIDTDWVARITVVKENGKSIRLNDTIIRSKYRNSYEKPEYLIPDEVYKYNIEIPFVMHTFEKGDSIRLQICSAMNTVIFPSTNTPYDDVEEDNVVIARQKVYFGEKYPSKMIINVLNKYY